MAEAGVAVSNALPSLKDKADWVTKGDHGCGVVELIEGLLKDDLHDLAVIEPPFLVQKECEVRG